MLVHEDFLDPTKSNQCVAYIKSLEDASIISDNPPVGHGASFYKLINLLPEIDYFMFWEDDYTLDVPIDLDKLLNLMDKYKNINQISFPKRNILKNKAWFIKKPVLFDDVKLTVSNHWYVSPGIWRYVYIMPYIKKMIKKYPVNAAGQLGFGWH
jgi:hypothetical protein